MTTMTLVLLGSDTDCDGTSYYAHSMKVPVEVVTGLEYPWSPLRALREEEPELGTVRFDEIYRVVSLDQFLAEVQPRQRDLVHLLDPTFRYCSYGADWNPWVYDDSIGIPALDHTYDYPIYSDDDIIAALNA